MLKICFDIGGVLTKYPEIFRPLIELLQPNADVEIHVVTDIPNKKRAVDLVRNNGFDIPLNRIHACDYAKYGENCKTIILEKIGADIHIDDFPAYLGGSTPIKLLMMPSTKLPYHHENWKDDKVKKTKRG